MAHISFTAILNNAGIGEGIGRQSYCKAKIGSLRYGHYGLRTTSGRENPSHAWTGPTTLKGRENWSVV